jgi:type I restriction enzyme S subunit
LDDKIELNRRMAETLEAMARALFRSWFVDFDPVRAKAESRPTRLSEEIAALFPSNIDNNALPAGWSLEPIREHLHVLSGGTPSKSDALYWGGDIPWVTPRSMMQSHVFDTEDRVTERAVGNGTRLAPCGSIMVMVRGMGLHQGVRISQARRDVTFNQDVKALISKKLDSAFPLYFMLHYQEDLFTKVRASGHGTGVLPSDALDSLVIPVPPAGVQQRLFLPFGLLNSRIALGRTEANSLAAMRDTLLPKLISGELRIKAAEGRIAAVV